MRLFKHPKEIPSNKKLLRKLIEAWSRRVFEVADDFRALGRDERESMDRDAHLRVVRRASTDGAAAAAATDNAYVFLKCPCA